MQQATINAVVCCCRRCREAQQKLLEQLGLFSYHKSMTLLLHGLCAVILSGLSLSEPAVLYRDEKLLNNEDVWAGLPNELIAAPSADERPCRSVVPQGYEYLRFGIKSQRRWQAPRPDT